MNNFLTTQWPNLIKDIRLESINIFNSDKPSSISRKSDGSFVTETDLLLQNTLSQTILSHLPDFPILGEEMSEEEQNRLIQSGNCWLLDPLDGTSNFAHGIPCYSISLALMVSGEIVAGMVYDPNHDELFSAVLGQGAKLNGQSMVSYPTTPQSIQQAISVIDTKRLPPNLAMAIVQQHPYHSQRSFGSVALDWCWLAMNRIQTYVHGKQKLWDFAAGALIAKEMGCLTQTFTKQDLLLPPLDLKPRSAIGAQASVAKEWKDWIHTHL